MENIEILRDKILLFNGFLITKLGMPKELFVETNGLIEKAYLEKNMKVLKAADNDIHSQLKHMSLSNLMELKNIFKEKINLDLDIIEKQYDKYIEKIIKREKISNADEYRLLIDTLETLSEAEVVKIEKINSLLINYPNNEINEKE